MKRTIIQQLIIEQIIQDFTGNLQSASSGSGKRAADAFKLLCEKKILQAEWIYTGSVPESTLGSMLNALFFTIVESDTDKLFEFFYNKENKYHTLFKNVNLLGLEVINRNVVNWLKEHPLLSVHAMEINIGCPKGTIQQALTKGERRIPEKYLNELIALLKTYGYE